MRQHRLALHCHGLDEGSACCVIPGKQLAQQHGWCAEGSVTACELCLCFVAPGSAADMRTRIASRIKLAYPLPLPRVALSLVMF